MIHRLPTNEHLRPYVRQLLSLMFRLLETENKENVLVCLRIVIELHKQYRPTYNQEVRYLNEIPLLYLEIIMHYFFLLCTDLTFFAFRKISLSRSSRAVR